MSSGGVKVSGPDPVEQLSVLAASLDAPLDVDLGAAFPDIVRTIRSEYQDRRLKGLGRDDRPLKEILPQTVKRRLRKYGPTGTGPPLNPRRAESRSNQITVESEQEKDKVNIVVSWPEAPFLIHHAEGAGNLPVRDILWIPDSAVDRATKIVADEVYASMFEGWDSVPPEPAHQPTVQPRRSRMSRLRGAIGGLFGRLFGR